MIFNKRPLGSIFTIGLFLTSCGGGTDNGTPDNPVNPQPPTPEKTEIRMSSRASSSDFSFKSNDAIGLYIVNYNGSTPGVLASSGSHVSNMKFTYSESVWNGTSPVYWNDDRTKADFYGYWPYISGISNVNAVAFSVKTDQTSESDYRSSDFLRGKTAGVAPTSSAVALTLDHKMSHVSVVVQPGTGFSQQDLESADISVTLNGIKTAASINLASGTVAASGSESSIKAYKESSTVHKAIVVPQNASNAKLVVVSINGLEYSMQKEIAFESGKSYTMTVTATKTSTGIEISIGSWSEADGDFGGTVS